MSQTAFSAKLHILPKSPFGINALELNQSQSFIDFSTGRPWHTQSMAAVWETLWWYLYRHPDTPLTRQSLNMICFRWQRTNSFIFMLGHAIIADTNLHGTSRHAFIRLAIYTANIVLSYRHMQFSQIHILDISAHCERFKQNLFEHYLQLYTICAEYLQV